MRLEAKIEGVEELLKNIDRYSAQKQGEVQRVINSTANAIRTESMRSMKASPASGNTYARRSIRHTASSQGNPPRVDTGRLINSIKMIFGRFEAIVGTNVDYGRHLEFGTKNMEPRPWLFPALERERRNFVSRIKAVFR
jgi:HK97 gp10 family phage protein